MQSVLLFLAAVSASGDTCSGFTPDAASFACYFNGCKTKDATGGCKECCDGCHVESSAGKGAYCMEDGGPSPSPTPVPGSDTWDSYEVAGMDVTSVTGGSDESNYEKVVIMLHGGGGSGSDWQYQYNSGWFGDLTGMKYVFPTSPLNGHVWFNTYKNGCGEDEDCAYDIPSIQDTGSKVAQLIEHEKGLVGGDASKVFLAGFSEGAQLTGYVQLAQLDYALGGAIVMSGFPLPPLCDMRGATQDAARANATYYGDDMRFMIWNGAADPIFQPDFTMNAWRSILDVLGVRSALQIDHVEDGMTHTVVKAEFDQMIRFVQGGSEPAIVMIV